MNNKGKSFLFCAMMSCVSISAIAAECNFDKQVGSCSGSVEILSTGGSKPSYTAEVRVTSSAPTCSKVEYYLDSTPNVTVLKSSNSDQESLFGTKPISRKNIRVKNCTAFASAGSSSDQKAKNLRPAKDDMTACIRRWKAYVAEREKKHQSFKGIAQYCD